MLFSYSPAINIGSLPVYLAILPDVKETIAFTIPYGIVTNPTIYIPKAQLMYDCKKEKENGVKRIEAIKVKAFNVGVDLGSPDGRGREPTWWGC